MSSKVPSHPTRDPLVWCCAWLCSERRSRPSLGGLFCSKQQPAVSQGFDGSRKEGSTYLERQSSVPAECSDSSCSVIHSRKRDD